MRGNGHRNRDARLAIQLFVEMVVDPERRLLDPGHLDLIVEADAYISRNIDRLSPGVADDLRKIAAFMQADMATRNLAR